MENITMEDVLGMLFGISLICGLFSVAIEADPETGTRLTYGRLILALLGCVVWIFIAVIGGIVWSINWFFTECKLTAFFRREVGK